MFWEDQIRNFLEDEKRLSNLIEENEALENLRTIEDHISHYNNEFGHISGYIKFEEVQELDVDQEEEGHEEYLYQYMMRTNELSSEIKKLQKRLKETRKDWMEEVYDLD